MIGQNKNKEIILNWALTRSVPRFILIEGVKGSGKFTLAQYISKSLHLDYALVDTSKSDITNVIESSYLMHDKYCYIVRDIDCMSDSAKNALLKITEEPPNQIYFIMTVNDINNIPSTIISRATLIRIEPYSMQELRNFTQNDLILKYFSVPGDILKWENDNINEFINFCDESVNIVTLRSGVETLQITNRLKIKQDQDGFDPAMFINVFSTKLRTKLKFRNASDAIKFTNYTSEVKHKLSNKSIKKDSLIDTYLLWVRDFIGELNETIS